MVGQRKEKHKTLVRNGVATCIPSALNLSLLLEQEPGSGLQPSRGEGHCFRDDDHQYCEGGGKTPMVVVGDRCGCLPIEWQKYQEAALQLFLTHPSQIVPLQVALALLPLLMSSAHAGEMQSVYKAIWDLACLAEHFKNSF